MKKIAILGKPNVGKSSLFNRLCKSNAAITSDVSGTTRDVRKGIFEIDGVKFELLDTGGLESATDANELVQNAQNKKEQKSLLARKKLFEQVSISSIEAGKSADLILYMTDSNLHDSESKILRALQKELGSQRIILAINKIDNDKLKNLAYEFENLGLETHFISVAHNRGISILLDALGEKLGTKTKFSESAQEDFLDDFSDSEILDLDSENSESDLQSGENEIKIGIIGRVNVGKSSLLNALLGQNRAITSEIAGTTIDPVSDSVQFKEHNLRFVDTAGIRRAGKIQGLEKFALDRTKKILEKSNIAILVLDASEPFVELDEKIGSLTQKNTLGVIIALNKWDIAHADFKKISTELKRKFKYLEFAPIVCVSAQNGRNIENLKEQILKVWRSYTFRIPTHALNECIASATARHHLPSDHGKIVKIYYATQFDSKPPKIALVMNRPNALHFSYKRYLVNVLRENFGFEGVPIVIQAKGRKNSESEENQAQDLASDEKVLEISESKLTPAQKAIKFGKAKDAKGTKDKSTKPKTKGKK